VTYESVTLHPPAIAQGIVRQVHDGDTLTVLVDLESKRLLGVPLWAEIVVRLVGCNARELSEPGGVEARDALAGLLPAGAPVTVTVLEPDKYGRRLGYVTTDWGGADERDVTEWLIAGGWAARWSGRGPKPVPAWPRDGGVAGGRA
jgi:endonuclease YncB( thermonuclease family)